MAERKNFDPTNPNDIMRLDGNLYLKRIREDIEMLGEDHDTRISRIREDLGTILNPPAAHPVHEKNPEQPLYTEEEQLQAQQEIFRRHNELKVERTQQPLRNLLPKDSYFYPIDKKQQDNNTNNPPNKRKHEGEHSAHATIRRATTPAQHYATPESTTLFEGNRKPPGENRTKNSNNQQSTIHKLLN